jgi:hypothetical protein
MNPRGFTLICLGLWFAAFAGSFLVFWITPAKDFGLTASLNRVGVFTGWQAAAGVVAVITWGAGSRLDKGTGLRQLSRVPFAIFAALIIAVIALVLFVGLTKPDPADPGPAAPVTQPAPSVDPGQ